MLCFKYNGTFALNLFTILFTLMKYLQVLLICEGKQSHAIISLLYVMNQPTTSTTLNKSSVS